MDHSQTTTPAPGAPPRRLLAFLLVVVAVAVTELASFVALSLTGEGWASWRRLDSQRAAVIADGAGQVDPAADRFHRQLPRRHRDEQALHPFLGFVLDPTRHPAARRASANPQSGELGFPFNTEPLIQERRDDRSLVLLLGGSVANMLANAGRASLRQELAKLPRFAGRRPVILSAANPGYKQPQQLIALTYLLALGAHFDLVLNLDGFNEVALPPVELIPNGVNPHFPQNWPLRVGDLDPRRASALGELAFLRHRRAARAATFSRFPLSRSFTAGLLWKVLDGRARGRSQELRSELIRSGGELTFQARGPRPELLTDAPAEEELITVWSRASVLLAELCHAHGIAYHHFLQPNQYDPGAKPLSPQELRTAWRADHPYRATIEAQYPRLRAAGAQLRQRGIAFSDLSRIFTGVEETLYLDDCCHLNARGNELLAKAVAAALTPKPNRPNL